MTNALSVSFACIRNGILELFAGGIVMIAVFALL